MDASDDAGIDADGPLDPRIQIELENLNNATDEINKLEIELDEAHTAFRQLLSDSTRRLKEIANKIGTGCIEKARCYYKALEVAQQAQIQCQRQAQLFQRASEIHSAAKETVALAEARFVSHQHEWNFDQAWQDMLNHATIKVMDAENQKAECGREHLRRATLFHDAEKKVQHLEEKHRRAIIKSRPYFEVRAQCDEMLATQKIRVEYLQKGVKKAKDSYAASLRILEDISNQIHQRRRDYDIMTKGPREPGVGAELISPTESLSYEAELDKLSLSRINSLASSEPDTDERAQDFEDVYDLKQRMEQLSARSVDGSESNSSQWELELQASVERLNTVPIRKLNSGTDFQDLKYNESGSSSLKNYDEKYGVNALSQVDELGKKSENECGSFKKPLARNNSTKHHQSWNSLSQSPTNSSFNKSATFSTQAFSKSLNNSLVNIGNIIFKKNSVDERASDNSQLPKTRSKSELETTKDVEKLDKPHEIDSKVENLASGKKKISVDTSNLEIAEFTKANLDNTDLGEGDEPTNDYAVYQKGHKSKDDNTRRGAQFSECESDCTILNRTQPGNNAQNERVAPSSEIFHFGSSSSRSTPAKHRKLARSKVAKSYENNLDKDDFVECPRPEKPSSKTSSVKELPLLSIIQRFPESRFSTRDKSCSMTDLAEKKNFKTIIDCPKS